MSRRPADLHSDWLRLLEPDGPFFTVQVLKKAFPLGLDRMSPPLRIEARERWMEARDLPDRADYVWWMLGVALEWEPRLRIDDEFRARFRHDVFEHGLTLEPDAVLANDESAESEARVLVAIWRAGTNPEGRVKNSDWSASPIQRMALLCRATGCPLGLVTDGDLFTLVWAPRNATTGHGTWRASIFSSEPAMLDSLGSLLSLQRFFGMSESDTPEAMLTRSAENESEITNTLGMQARRAVELLVNAISRGDLEQNGRLLGGVTAHDVYEAAVTVLMRLVILLTAEENGLLPAGDDFYAANYAISSLKADLEDAEALLNQELELRSTAWHRMLAVTRAVYGGANHHDLRIPAYGSRLFDPDRFPFLEGRLAEETQGTPIPIDDLSMLGIMRALQELQIGSELRKLSYKHLEVEQIGHVYEGLLDHSAVAADRMMLGLVGKKGNEPEVALEELEGARLDGKASLLAFLHQCTGNTERQLAKLLDIDISDSLRRGLLVASNNDSALVGRLLPFAGLLRQDLRGVPLVFPPGAMFVTETSHKRDSGTAYTTRELAEEVAQYALEPLVYAPGPLEIGDPSEWRLKSSTEILDLKVCDPAVGSGAVLVAACRYLADRLVEAWEREGIIDQGARDAATAEDPNAIDVRVEARRAVAERCLYAVDRDPMAVEMAKLSLWLVTMAKERPFSFLDHSIVSGDSLLGITDIRQLTHFHIDPTEAQPQLMADASIITSAVKRSTEFRLQIEETPVRTVVDARRKQNLLNEARELVADLSVLADIVIGAALAGGAGRGSDDTLMASLEDARLLLDRSESDARGRLESRARRLLNTDRPDSAPPRYALHWALTFPEVLGRDEKPGFDAVVGNPPFLGGQRISGAMGTRFRNFLVSHIAGGRRGSADLVAYFFLRAASIVAPEGVLGFLATNTIAQGDTREVGLDWLLGNGWSIHRAVKSRPWPGAATLEIAQLWMTNRSSISDPLLDGELVSAISATLTRNSRVSGNPHRLTMNAGQSFIGSYVLGLGFVVSPDEARGLIARNPGSAQVLFPYLNGENLNTSPIQQASRWVINFFDWPEERAEEYEDCWRIIEERVRPERRRLKSNGDFQLRRPLPHKWWIYAEKRPALYRTIANLDRVLVITQTSKTLQPALVPTGQVFMHKLVVFAYDDHGHFGLLSGSFHWHWAVLRGSTMRVDPVYTPSDVFLTFPKCEMTDALTDAGQMLHEHRSALMVANNEGLTKTYNRVHGDDRSVGIDHLRELHVDLDRAVAEAYGWADLELGHGLHWTSQGIRFTISPVAQQEVLDRLLELNHLRHAEEVAAGHTSRSARVMSTRPMPSLFQGEDL